MPDFSIQPNACGLCNDLNTELQNSFMITAQGLASGVAGYAVSAVTTDDLLFSIGPAFVSAMYGMQDYIERLKRIHLCLLGDFPTYTIGDPKSLDALIDRIAAYGCTPEQQERQYVVKSLVCRTLPHLAPPLQVNKTGETSEAPDYQAKLLTALYSARSKGQSDTTEEGRERRHRLLAGRDFLGEVQTRFDFSEIPECSAISPHIEAKVLAAWKEFYRLSNEWLRVAKCGKNAPSLLPISEQRCTTT